MMEWDATGRYYYEPGYCTRDAFRQAFGDGRADGWFPYDCPNARIRDFCTAHGYPCVIDHVGFPARPFRIGAPVVWIIAIDAYAMVGHAVYQPDPRIVLMRRDWGECIICGYALLEL